MQFLTLQTGSLFGYDDALLAFNEYFDDKEATEENEYTGILKGKNIVFVHMEGMQTFLMDLEFNGEEVTPNLNRFLAENIEISNMHMQSYSSTGHVTESSNSTIFLSSKEEINSICGGYATDFSDLAIDYLNSPYGDGQYYFVRDLGSNLNSVCSYTSGGGEIYNKPISVLGMRLTIKISEYICL